MLLLWHYFLSKHSLFSFISDNILLVWSCRDVSTLPDLHHSSFIQQCVCVCVLVCVCLPTCSYCRLRRGRGQTLPCSWSQVPGECDVFLTSGCHGDREHEGERAVLNCNDVPTDTPRTEERSEEAGSLFRVKTHTQAYIQIKYFHTHTHTDSRELASVCVCVCRKLRLSHTCSHREITFQHSG